MAFAGVDPRAGQWPRDWGRKEVTVIGRLVGLCLAEAALVIMLAVQVSGAADAPPPTANETLVPTRDAAPDPSPANIAPPTAAGERSDATPLVERTAAAAKWRQDDPVGVLLMGTVRQRDGSPADANLSFELGKVRRGTSTEKDGSFALAGLQPGEWDVALSGDAVVEAKQTVILGDDAVQRRDLVCDPSFPVKVRIVTPDGQDATRGLRMALPGFGDFSVAGQREPFPEHLAPTDYGVVFVGDARWNSEMNPSDGFAGTLFVSSLPAHVALLQRHLVLQQQLVPPGQSEVKFVVDVGELTKLAASATLRVLDETGAPLANATVALHTSNRGGGGPKTDEAGRITLEKLSPGLLQLSIQAKEREAVWKMVQVEPGQRADLGEFRLGPLAPLKGTVLDADGKPAGGSLRWTELKWRTGPTAFRTNRTTQIEADGSFSLWGTGSGPIAVQVHTQDGQVASGVFDNPPSEPVVLRLGKAAQCVVTRPIDPTRSFTVTLFDAQRRPIEATTLGARTGKATISLPPGTYAFEVHDERQRLVQSGSLLFGATPCSLEIR